MRIVITNWNKVKIIMLGSKWDNKIQISMKISKLIEKPYHNIITMWVWIVFLKQRLRKYFEVVLKKVLCLWKNIHQLMKLRTEWKQF